MKRYCPKCGGVFAGERCPCTPRSKRRPTAGDRTRSEREPWRKRYSDPGYRASRQEAIARTRGRCRRCGRVVAVEEGGVWRTLPKGEVHHRRALCEGGDDAPANLELLCKGCHAEEDAKRRRLGR